jgi:uncharacterized membrane protein YbaN (DUF454 family)
MAIAAPSLADTPPPVALWRKIALGVVAAVTLVLAILGALLPGLPATPFLLITSYCLLRTSPRLHGRLLRSPLLGPLLSDWQRHRGIRREVKVKSVAIVCLVLGLTLWISPLVPLAKLGVLALGLVGIGIVLRLPEITPQG